MVRFFFVFIGLYFAYNAFTYLEFRRKWNRGRKG
jgi:hypothetical protein